MNRFEITFTAIMATVIIHLTVAVIFVSVKISALQREIELELERKRLENEKLKREIELLDQAQQYRCCPVGEAEDDDD